MTMKTAMKKVVTGLVVAAAIVAVPNFAKADRWDRGHGAYERHDDRHDDRDRGGHGGGGGPPPPPPGRPRRGGTGGGRGGRAGGGAGPARDGTVDSGWGRAGLSHRVRPRVGRAGLSGSDGSRVARPGRREAQRARLD